MKNKFIKNIYSAGLFFILIFIPISYAQAEIPQEVTAQKVNVYGNASNFEGDGPLNVEIKNGRVTEEGKMRDGQRLARVNNIEYNLDFWNVGEEGGKEGMLFWKKDYGLATLTLTYGFEGPGRIIKKGPDLGDYKSFKFEDASSEPSAQLTYHLKFTGGPNGSFEELAPYISKAGPLMGRITKGKTISFDFPYDKKTKYPYIFARWLDMPWDISGDPFYGYDLEGDGPCARFVSDNLDNPSNDQLALIPKAQAQDSGARFTDFTGEVTVSKSGNPDDEIPAELDMVLGVGNRVNTYEESCAIISFGDMTTFVLPPNTTVIIDTPPQRHSKMSLLAGKIWAKFKNIAKDGTLDVKMNQAVAGIKGTTFVLEEAGTKSTIKVIEGDVKFTSLANKSEVMVGGGESVAATSKGLSEKTKFDVAEENKKWGMADKSSQSTRPDQSSKKNKIYVLIAGVIILAAGLIGTYFFVRARKRKKKSVQ